MGGELEQETAADRERLLVGRLLRLAVGVEHDRSCTRSGYKQ